MHANPSDMLIINMEGSSQQFIILNQILVYLLTDSQEKISTVLTQIRALKGVVTLSVAQATASYSNDEHITKLRLKFLASTKAARSDLKELKKCISNITGVTNVIIKLARSRSHHTQEPENLKSENKPQTQLK